MLTRLIALIVVTAVGVYYIAFDAVGIKIINKPFTVQATFTDSRRPDRSLWRGTR